jgi:hypothetical protein
MKPMTVIGLGGGGNIEETKYTLKFVIDGTTKFQEKLESGEPIPFNVNGEIESRTFLGWYNGSTLYKEGDLMPSKSLTLTAKYECDVTFNFIIDNVIEEVLNYSVAYNTVVKEIPETEKEGYDFLGWVPSISEPITAHTNFSGTFQEKVEAPIYYGSYVTPISAYSADNVSKYYNETDLNTVYYDSISISECVNGAEIIIFMPAYEPLTGLTDRNAGKEAEKYYEPPVFIIPASVIDKYSVSIRDGIGVEQWSNFITDNNILNINGTDYYFYSRIPNDTLIPGKDDNSDMKVTIKLTEK